MYAMILRSSVTSTIFQMLSIWLADNKLSLNANKTKFMVFHFYKNKIRYPKLHINVTEIERTDYFNFLGLQLNHYPK